MSTEPVEDASTTDLLKDIGAQATRLFDVELEMAKDEFKRELASAERAAVGFGASALLLGVAVTLLAVAAVLALGATPLAALVGAAVFFLGAGLAGVLAFSALPKKVAPNTQKRVSEDVHALKESAA